VGGLVAGETATVVWGTPAGSPWLFTGYQVAAPSAVTKGPCEVLA
jgi:hypothetical protein